MLILSGNLSFLNWLTIAPAVACFPDAVLLPWCAPLPMQEHECMIHTDSTSRRCEGDAASFTPNQPQAARHPCRVTTGDAACRAPRELAEEVTRLHASETVASAARAQRGWRGWAQRAWRHDSDGRRGAWAAGSTLARTASHAALAALLAKLSAPVVANLLSSRQARRPAPRVPAAAAC